MAGMQNIAYTGQCRASSMRRQTHKSFRQNRQSCRFERQGSGAHQSTWDPPTLVAWSSQRPMHTSIILYPRLHNHIFYQMGLLPHLFFCTKKTSRTNPGSYVNTLHFFYCAAAALAFFILAESTYRSPKSCTSSKPSRKKLPVLSSLLKSTRSSCRLYFLGRNDSPPSSFLTSLFRKQMRRPIAAAYFTISR